MMVRTGITAFGLALAISSSTASAQQLLGNPGEPDRGKNVGSGTGGGDSRAETAVAKRVGRIAAGTAIGAAVGAKVGKVVTGGARGSFLGTFLAPAETARPELDMHPNEAELFEALGRNYARATSSGSAADQKKAAEINAREKRGGPGSIRDATAPGKGQINDAPKSGRDRVRGIV